LAQALSLSWLPKVTEGFFLRAESFYNFATYIDEVSNLRTYGGKSLHAQSPGESFISLFANRFEQGIYILDEDRSRARSPTSSSTEAPGRVAAGTSVGSPRCRKIHCTTDNWSISATRRNRPAKPTSRPV
jgi:hypothetical protein